MMVFATIVVAVMLVVVLSVLRPLLGAKAITLDAMSLNRIVQRISRITTPARYGGAGLVMLVVASAAALLYFNPVRLNLGGQKEAAAPAPMRGMELPQLTSKLAARLEHNADDSEGWLLLGKSYTQLGRYAEAKQALSRALTHLPQTADVLCDWVDTMVMAEQGRWDAEARKTLAATLAANPMHQRTLWLAGSEALDRKAYDEAERYWEKLSTLAGADTENGRAARAGLEKARALAAGRSPA